jgi:hypothetical protein
LAARISNIRCGIKRAIAPKIEIAFGFHEKSIPETKQIVSELLDSGAFIYPDMV